MHIFVIFGTRPEAIKLAPIIQKARLEKEIRCTVCSTGQHLDLVSSIIEFFNIEVDIQLNLMSKNQSLSSFSSVCLIELDQILKKWRPNLVLVQGDTSTAFIGALSAFNNKIPCGHVEAGLRSFNKFSPFPEEMNRSLISKLALIHFAPTKSAYNNLLDEGINEKYIFEVGNTVVDTCLMVKEQMECSRTTIYTLLPRLDQEKEIVLITCHRRENHGLPLRRICESINHLAEKYFSELQFVFPVHPNPNVSESVNQYIDKKFKNILLTKPLAYPDLIFLLSQTRITLTDSGGIQEEAPTFNVPILILRENTERMEGVAQGSATLVGSNKQAIIEQFDRLYEAKNLSQLKNPYGQGDAADKIIAEILQLELPLPE